MIYLYVIIVVAIVFMAFYLFRKMLYETLENIFKLPENLTMTKEDFPTLLISLDRLYKSPYKHLIIDFRNVKVITYPAYMVIIAQVEKIIYAKKVEAQVMIGNYNSDVFNVVFNTKNSKFHHKHVKYEKLEKTFLEKSRELDPDITSGLENKLRSIGVIDYFELNTLVMELLGNAIEHGIKNKEINWWMHHRYDSLSKSVKVAFVDMGMGIVSSYRKAGLPEDYNDRGDKQIVSDALHGILGSSTKEENRGLGLPQILRMVQNKWLSDFVLITNTVSVRFIGNSLQYQEHSNFVGTFYSFSINKNNFDTWKRELTSL